MNAPPVRAAARALVLSSFGSGINDIRPKDLATPTGARARVGRPSSTSPAPRRLTARWGQRIGWRAVRRDSRSRGRWRTAL